MAKKKAILEIPEDLISDYEDFFVTLKKKIEGKAKSALILDGSHVGRIGVAGVQVLLAAAATCSEKGRVFGVDAASDVLRETFCDFGLESVFSDLEKGEKE